MSPSTFTSTWTLLVVLALLAISVHAHPIRESSTETAAQPESNIQPRDPRLIPDAEHYLGDVFRVLGVADPSPTPSEQPTPTFTPSIPMNIKIEHDKPMNIKATPVVSSSTTVSTHPVAAYTTVIRHGDTKPIENIQIGSGWNGKKKLTAEDLPVIFDAVTDMLSSRFRDMIDSSDEIGLAENADEGLLDYLR